MLVLKRKIGETVMIGDDIEVVVLGKEGDTVKIGIRAPRTVRVYRQEIYEEIRAENRSALQAPALDVLRQLFQKKSEE
ncbi:carbon storage regulator CsrA [Tumebacillus sp. DT12]|uniref:Translational regulator CsrA n=1 Tax=Tumebacillus lacus TaxID=2995335 RepID=A0ABT3X0G9_9BACL|nr:carbon storage regulator CsrA [Tumebacillus lacus]MCX7569468.1 carbon storage regulator CsrA [Tumebacillus lacus]